MWTSHHAILIGREELVDEPVAWPVTGRRVLAEGHIGTFVEEQVSTPDGETMTREYLLHPGAVGIIALDDSERVALVRQYRHPVRHRLIEPPAGLLDVSGENPLLAAQRELAEEVGLAAGSWHVLVDLFTTPGHPGRDAADLPGPRSGRRRRPRGFRPQWRRGPHGHRVGPAARSGRAVLAGDLHNPTMVSGVLRLGGATGRLRRPACGRRPLAGPRPLLTVRGAARASRVG